jgi:hypothetical protein
MAKGHGATATCPKIQLLQSLCLLSQLLWLGARAFFAAAGLVDEGVP